jgi:carbamoylphosphate synthase large subunit
MNKAVELTKLTSIVIFGRYTTDWQNSLGPFAQLWKDLKIRKIRQITKLSTLKEYCRLNKVDIIIPFMEKDIAEVISFNNSFNNNGSASLVPNIETLNAFADKSLFTNFIDKHNLNTYCPVTYYNFKGLLVKPTDIIFPCIFKASLLNNGDGLNIIMSPNELLPQIEKRGGTAYVIQEYIDGKSEYTSNLICKDGLINKCISYKFCYENEYVIKNHSTILQSEAFTLNSNQLDVFKKFIHCANYSGPCNIDYKLNDNGDPIIFEINPRFGGSLFKPENYNDLCLLMLSLIEILGFSL